MRSRKATPRRKEAREAKVVTKERSRLLKQTRKRRSLRRPLQLLPKRTSSTCLATAMATLVMPLS